MTKTRHVVRITAMNVPEPPLPFFRAVLSSGDWLLDAALPFSYEDLVDDATPTPTNQQG